MAWTELMQKRATEQALMKQYWTPYVTYIGECYKKQVAPESFKSWFQKTRPDSSWITKAS